MKFKNVLKMLGLSLLVAVSTQTTKVLADESDLTESYAIEPAVAVESSVPNQEPEKIMDRTETPTEEEAPAREPIEVEPEVPAEEEFKAPAEEEFKAPAEEEFKALAEEEASLNTRTEEELDEELARLME